MADFLGGLQSRRVPVVVVLLIVEGGRAARASWSSIVATGEPLPGTRAILFALGAGVAGAVALGCFYRALAIGTMSIVAPISSTGVALPVIVGIATGDRPSLLVVAGLVVAVVGVLLASREQHDDAEQAAAGRAAAWLALVAAVGFGVLLRVHRRRRRLVGAVAAASLSRARRRAALTVVALVARGAPPAARAPRSCSRSGAARRRRDRRSTGWRNDQGRAQHRLGRRGAVSGRHACCWRACVLGERLAPRAGGGRRAPRCPASR